MTISQLHLEALDALSNADLAMRMDSFFDASEVERYGPNVPKLGGAFKRSVSEFLSTTTITQIGSAEVQRRALYAAFDFMLQIEFLAVGGAASNRMIYDSDLFGTNRFESPTIQLRFGALRQWSIIASRIVFERLADVIHILETGRRIEGKKSKFKQIQRIFSDPTKPWCYFAPYLNAVRQFDNRYRTREVHGGSPMPRKLLTLLEPTSEELNAQHQLTNLMHSVRSPFIQLLNYERPTQFFGIAGDDEWMSAYATNDVKRIKAWITKRAGDLIE